MARADLSNEFEFTLVYAGALTYQGGSTFSNYGLQDVRARNRPFPYRSIVMASQVDNLTSDCKG